jgi:hypothetical protein
VNLVLVVYVFPFKTLFIDDINAMARYQMVVSGKAPTNAHVNGMGGSKVVVSEFVCAIMCNKDPICRVGNHI